MSCSYCGISCADCGLKSNCKGCISSGGKPFSGTCPIADCCREKSLSVCEDCPDNMCSLRQTLICEFNEMHIPGLPEITSLNALAGFYVNLEYPLGNTSVRLLNDNDIYLGNQLECENGRCFGIVANREIMLVCTYGENGSDPELLFYRRRS